jgi:hypothetical protein
MYIASAGIHHGSPGGEPVIINTSIADDYAMSQVTMFRPKCCLHQEAYDTRPGFGLPLQHIPSGCTDSCAYLYNPWPLSMDFILAGTDEAEMDKRSRLLLVDRLGNVDVLSTIANFDYRGNVRPRDNPSVRWVMPLAPREQPPAIPSRTFQGERAGTEGHVRATISLLNIYQSDFTWPANTRIKALRVVQLAARPWGAPLMTQPEMGYGLNGTGASTAVAGAVYCAGAN